MNVAVIARSISRQLRIRLRQRRPAAQVLSVFESVCNLLTDDDDLVSLVVPRVGNGPYNVVLDNVNDLRVLVDSQADVTIGADRLHVGDLTIDLEGAAVWESCPDWYAMRTLWVDRPPVTGLDAFVVHHTARSAFYPLLQKTSAGSSHSIFLRRALQAVADLRAGWFGDRECLKIAAYGLAGLGGGLTPAGDDLLVGLIHGAWLFHPTPALVCQPLLETAAARTTTLSAAFLRAAAAGQCSAAWHALIVALVSNTDPVPAMHRILGYGATSGADALIGFLLAQQWTVQAHQLLVRERSDPWPLNM